MAYTARLPLPVVEEWDWQRLAACRGMDTARFFHPPAERGAPWRRREEAAKRVCAGCPVQTRCLEYALRIEEPYGVWGGVGERQRWEMVTRRRRLSGRRRRRNDGPAGQARPA